MSQEIDHDMIAINGELGDLVIVPVVLISQNECLIDCNYSTMLIFGDLSTQELVCDGHEDDFLLHQESWTESGARRSSGRCWRDGWGIAG